YREGPLPALPGSVPYTPAEKLYTPEGSRWRRAVFPYGELAEVYGSGTLQDGLAELGLGAAVSVADDTVRPAGPTSRRRAHTVQDLARITVGPGGKAPGDSVEMVVREIAQGL